LIKGGCCVKIHVFYWLHLLEPYCSIFQIGAFAAPDKIHWAPGLPKTRSGKIMRRVLRKIASKQLDELGDTSTLAEPHVVEQLIELADC
jgi:acetyl-CoA synthetase